MKVKLNPFYLKSPLLMNGISCSIECFNDVSLGDLPTGKRTRESIIIICAEFGNCTPLNWKSRSTERNLQSSLSAEACSMVDTLDGLNFIFNLKEVLYGPFNKYSNHNIRAYTESKSL